MITDAIVQARRCVIDPATVIDNATIKIKNGVIVDVAKTSTPTDKAVDLGNVTVIPGLVNSHTHLEFSDLVDPLGEAGMAFVDWLKLVIGQRIAAGQDHGTTSRVIAAGINECAEAGVAMVGEIATAPLIAKHYQSDSLETVVFFERLGRNPDTVKVLSDDSRAWVNGIDVPPVPSNVSPAISPHAPYSVHPDLMMELILQAVQFNVPVAMHLAETREELELLQDKTGPFVEFLKEVSAWYPDSHSQGTQIIEYLRLLATTPLGLVVHGNYLNEQDINFLATQKNLHVVYCPRTHDFFQHSEYPLGRYLEAGIQMAIGTDSRASNPNLSVFEELKFIKNRWPNMVDLEILSLATNGMPLRKPQDSTWVKPGNRCCLNVIYADFESGIFSDNVKCVPLANCLAD